MNTAIKVTKEVLVEEESLARDKSIGLLLKRARLARKKTLENVCKVLYIKEVYLRAIEEDRVQDLPKQNAYTIGFVRSYADFLGLDPVAITASFKAQHALSPSLQLQDAHEEELESLDAQSEETAHSFLLGWVFLGAGLFLLLLLRETLPLPGALKSFLDHVANIF